MNKITITLGEVVSKLECSKIELDAIREYFKARPNGYNHSKLFKSRKWDGYKYLVTGRGEFGTGFMPNMLSFLSSTFEGTEIEILDKRQPVHFKETFTNKLPNGWELFQHQEEAVKNLIASNLTVGEKTFQFHRGVYDVATNGGKTSIMAGILENLHFEKCLVLVDRVLIKDQLAEFFKDCGYEVGQIDSKSFTVGKVTVASLQTIASKTEDADFTNQFDVLFVDECHRACGDTYKKFILACKSAKVRCFFSGTPFDITDKVDKLYLIGMSGSTISKVSNAEMVEQGVSQKPLVNIHRFDLGKAQGLDYETSYELCMTNEIRLAKTGTICLYELGKGGKVLITFVNQEHGKCLGNMLEGYGIPHHVVDSYDEERKEKIEDFKKSEVNVLVASMILKEGINIPDITCLIMYHGQKSTVNIKQFIGRAIRQDGVSDTVNIHDFYDLGNSYIEAHSRARLKIYEKEGFEISYNYKNKKGKPI